MITIKKFTFNPFQENTYILYDDTKSCIIVDPGCFNSMEREQLSEFIGGKDLIPKRLINTHAHIDHVLGNRYVADKYDLGLELFKSSYNMLDLAARSAQVYGVPYDTSPEPSRFIEEGETINFGESALEVMHVPGHAPDHIVLLHKEQKFLIGGDVLFKGSIGRTDLPGGNHHELLDNIQQKIFVLDEEIVVYSGHGEETTVGEEQRTNPFFPH